MARTTEDKVRGVLGVDANTLSNSEISPFINEANVLVNQRLEGHVADTSLLTLIETRVAAHYSIPILTGESKGKEKASIGQGSAQVKYVGPDKRQSVHWDRAIELDPTGRLDTSIRNATVEKR